MNVYVASARRPLEFRRRADVRATAVTYDDRLGYVLSDPLSNEHYQLTLEEHFVWERVQPATTLESLQREFEQKFAPRRIDVAELERFLQRLHRQRLIASVRPGQAAALSERAAASRGARRRAALGNLLALPIAQLPTAPWLARLDRWSRPWTGRAAAWLVVATACAAAVRLAPRSADLAADLAQTLRFDSWTACASWLLAIAGVKCLHELGHALACQRQGAECRQVGVLLLAGCPALYCDASDAWRLPDKRRRMRVAAAGMVVEVALAAAALLLWTCLAPGASRLLCAQLAVVCSLGSLLVNANPLLRYDGYYLLSDWLEIPNMAERAREVWVQRGRAWLLGERCAPDPWLAPPQRRALAVYAVASRVYLGVLLGGLFATAWIASRPYGAEAVVALAALAAAAGLLARPVAAAWRLARNPAARARLRPGRAVALGATLAALAFGGWHVPVVRSVVVPVRLAGAEAHALYAPVDAFLVDAQALGAEVAAGDVAIRLVDPDLDWELVRQRGLTEALELRAASLATLRRRPDEVAARQAWPAAEAAARESRALLAQWERAAEALEVRAVASGRLAGAAPRTAETAKQTLGGWHGQVLEPRNLGAWVRQGDLLGVVQSPAATRALAGVPSHEVAAVRPGQAVRLVVQAEPFAAWQGRVERVSERPQPNRPEGSAHASTSAAQEQYHVVEIALDEIALDKIPRDKASAALRPGMCGMARIETYRTTLGELLTRAWRQWWNLT